MNARSTDIAALFAVAGGVLCTPAASAQITSTFDTGDEGWGTINDTSSFGFDGTIGNPPGSIVGDDAVVGDIWYFSAPEKFLGDRSGSFGLSLSWDILGLVGDQEIDGPADVILESGDTRIGLNLDFGPSTETFSSVSVELDADGWEFMDTSVATGGDPVDEATFRGVLADLDGLFIRGEYTNFADSAALDNVVLDVPAPAGAGALAAAGLVASRRRRVARPS